MAERCFVCGYAGPLPVLSLGEMPLANRLLSDADLDKPEICFALALVFCERCALLQLTESVDPQLLFGEYAYFSSYSTTMVTHAERLVQRLVRERRLGAGDLAVEIASNDGYLLQHYLHSGVPVLGIDPALNVVQAARRRGVATLDTFFSLDLAKELVAQGMRASVIHANNVLAHVPDVDGVVAGIGLLLAPDGIAVVETPYVRDLVTHTEFDTVYHEHLFYYSLLALERLFARNGLTVVDVERLPIHGGSLRVSLARSDSPEHVRASVAELLAEEERLGLASSEYFADFAARVDELVAELRTLVLGLKSDGHRIAAYGAAAKGATLLNAIGIGREVVEFVADRSEYKQGLYMPGVKVPIVEPGRLLDEMPDEVILLAWNFADEVLRQQEEYRRRGGRFIIPVPRPTLV